MKSLIALIALTGAAYAAPFKEIPKNESITPLLEGQREITSLSEIARLGLNQGKTGIELWSGHYWPHYQGLVGIRYRDMFYQDLIERNTQFKSFKELYEKTPLYSYRGKENSLSPAEKYDLLVGDTNMTLTKYSWETSGKAASISGDVPVWRGLCDGWSAASQMMPRPTKPVTLTTPAGLPLTFYPEDLKALGSLSYGRSQNNVIFLGKRCRGAISIFTGSCEGTNPGAFHKALINRVGSMKKSFIADVSPGKEVWNYPVLDYKISYYNVFTEEESSKFEDQMELFTKKNRFYKSSRRHEKTYAIVGVKAVVTYVDMKKADLADTDSKARDKYLEKTYEYDLELDRNYNILGGEWFGNTMPDFMWAPDDGKYPLSFYERNNGTPKTAVEISAAAKASSKDGQPLSVVIERLFELAK